mgnify:CR=1 FL=1
MHSSPRPKGTRWRRESSLRATNVTEGGEDIDYKTDNSWWVDELRDNGNPSPAADFNAICPPMRERIAAARVRRSRLPEKASRWSAYAVELLVQSRVWIAVKAHCTGLAGDFCG